MSFGGGFGEGAKGAPGTNGTSGAAGPRGQALLNDSGAPYEYAANSSWSTATTHTLFSFTFTAVTAKARVEIGSNFGGTNNSDATLSMALDGVANTTKGAELHAHTASPRAAGALAFTYTGLTANQQYTCTVSLIVRVGTWTMNALSTGDLHWIQAEARDAA